MPPRSPLTESIERVGKIFSEINALSEDEKNLLLDWWVPVTEAAPAKKLQKKAGRKSSKKSARAQSLSGVIQRTPKTTVASDDNEDDDRCTYKIGEDAGGPIVCDTLIDNNVHHKQTDPDFHPFQPSVHAAPNRSPANGGAGIQSASEGPLP